MPPQISNAGLQKLKGLSQVTYLNIDSGGWMGRVLSGAELQCAVLHCAVLHCAVLRYALSQATYLNIDSGRWMGRVLRCGSLCGVAHYAADDIV